MPGAYAKPRKGAGGGGPEEDAFVRGINRLAAWVQENTRTVVLGVVVVTVVVVGVAAYRNQLQSAEEEATAQLQTLQAALASGADTLGVVQRLQAFLDRHGGTDAARQARILLAREQLARGRAEEAARTVQPAAQEPTDTPTGHAARLILADARQAAGDHQGALDVLAEVAEGARYPFQRHEAAAKRARILTEQGRLEEAEAIYRRLVEASEGDPAGDIYALRLGEVQAMQATGAGTRPGSGTDSGDAASPTGGTESDGASDATGGGS